ncbi:PD-(D/E)XK nuclease family protein [Hymenobacter algoricola]|uniref:PD-(D/E)XK nuclease family protein n=1 Tax=Hymenobacter algoricola TaxID=486267 RepID=A0ABP7MTH0_9BACT
MQQLQHLLDKLELIRLRQEGRQSTDSFNIFRLLRPEHDEVNLHSRFLHELLNPKGSHGMEDAFLRLFAVECELPSLSYDTVQVLREHANIDILIQDRHQAIVIENKIYAGDQHEQLKRYHDIVVRSLRTPTLFYLTLDGNPPSDWSVGDLQAEVRCLAYSQEIDRWLTACIKEAALKPSVRETIIQYQQLIHQLTGKTMNEEEKQQVLTLMAKDNNAEQAAIIARNWSHVRWHTEWDFWNELLALVENKYEVSTIGKFSDESISRTVHGSRNRSPWYGLSFCVGNLHGAGVNVRIERNEGPIYYGYPYPFDETQTELRSKIKMAIEPLTTQHSPSWAGLKSNNTEIDFESFNTPVTLQLANPEKRRIIVSQFFQELQEFIAVTQIALQQQFNSDFTPVQTPA